MLACNRCGQCSHISDARFIEFASISGTERRELDPETGDCVEYGEYDNMESTGDSEYECPYCSSSNIDWDSEMTPEESAELRQAWLIDQSARAVSRETLYREAAEKLVSEWDFAENTTSNEGNVC